MRILVCALEAPVPPYNGLQLQLSSLIEQLDQRHEVRVLGFVPPGSDAAPGEHGRMRLLPRPLGGRLGKLRLVAKAMVSGRPVGVDSLTGAMRGALLEELGGFGPDVLHVTSGELAPLLQGVAAPPAVIAVLDSWYQDRLTQVADSSGVRRWLLQREAERVRRHEATQYRRYERVVVVSGEDRRAVASLDPRLRLEIIPNGVDADAFAPDPDARRDPDRVVFHGSLGYGPNVVAAEFLARRVMPLVRRELTGAHLAIVGRSPSRRILALAGLPGVQVVGEVPDVRSWLTGSRVYACAMLSGQGIKNKLLEAMACGVPSVATPQSLGGLTVEAGREVLVADGAEPFARALVTVLTDDAEAARLGAAGRAYVVARHTWASVGLAFERVYGEAIEERTRSGRL